MGSWIQKFHEIDQETKEHTGFDASKMAKRRMNVPKAK